MGIIGVDAARVADEHGKGIEVLRQQVVQFSNASGRQTMLLAEAATLLRYIKVSNPHTAALVTGSFRLSRRGPGGVFGEFITASYSFNTTNLASDDFVEIPLLNTKISKGELVVAEWSGTGDTPKAAHLGWMPDMWDLEEAARTYFLPT